MTDVTGTLLKHAAAQRDRSAELGTSAIKFGQMLSLRPDVEPLRPALASHSVWRDQS